ncbi:MAG TPA: hypothetical protein PKM73_01265 [Verrucomicrobiota bacterium]|nr:hypothetical protein [Verrucomicrobiota bacterium]HNU50013.1 hypothetical protein [Verrucomicrobiota bacterium]
MNDPSQPSSPPDPIAQEILRATAGSRKLYGFNDTHDPRTPADFWFQESDEGRILFAVFYTQACRWSRCLGCNLPTRMSQHPVGFRLLMAQVDALFAHPDVMICSDKLRKVIVSNNGSVLDQVTFSSTALIYLIAKLNLHLPRLAVLSLETRIEHVEIEELEFIARALREGETPTQLELAIGFEAFDNRVRNDIFRKGLQLHQFENLCRTIARYRFHLKCYFMLKPIPGMTADEAVSDIHRAIDYLSAQARACGVTLNLHLNPTYVAAGTVLEQHFRDGTYTPPTLRDTARAALHAQGTPLTVFLGLSDEGLACPGGSFVQPQEGPIVAQLEAFNRTQDYAILRSVAGL